MFKNSYRHFLKYILTALLFSTAGCSPLPPLPGERQPAIATQTAQHNKQTIQTITPKPQPFFKSPPPRLQASTVQNFLAEKPKPAIAETPPGEPYNPVATSIVRKTTTETQTKTVEAPLAQNKETITPPLKGGAFLLPVKGNIVSGYGTHGNGDVNDGINILAPSGTAVRAAESGVVVYAGNRIKGFGNLILIRHDQGFVTTYAHLENSLVQKGDAVIKGQTIGKVGKTGSVDRPQLHFEIRKNSEPVDPKDYL